MLFNYCGVFRQRVKALYQGNGTRRPAFYCSEGSRGKEIRCGFMKATGVIMLQQGLVSTSSFTKAMIASLKSIIRTNCSLLTQSLMDECICLSSQLIWAPGCVVKREWVTISLQAKLPQATVWDANMASIIRPYLDFIVSHCIDVDHTSMSKLSENIHRHRLLHYINRMFTLILPLPSYKLVDIVT